jgi:aspartate dehydrogenase
MNSVVVIGYGAIGQEVVAGLRSSSLPPLRLGVLLRDGSPTASLLPADVIRLRDITDVLSFGPAVVAEAAGGWSVRNHAKPCLKAGIPFLISSVGALVDDALLEGLLAAARENSAKVMIPSGALASLDYVRAVRCVHGTQVRYESRKPPSAWQQELTERGVDPAALSEPLVLFSGDARTAAQLYPKNLNVAATLAIVGVGLDETQVEVVVDPAAKGNTHSIRVYGPAGELETRIVNRPSSLNPKTSWIVGKSIVSMIERQLSPLIIG